jgi:hypothetical protein
MKKLNQVALRNTSLKDQGPQVFSWSILAPNNLFLQKSPHEEKRLSIAHGQ